MEKIKRNDCVSRVNELGEISIPIGHYALIDTTKISEGVSPKLVIYGIGSCVALILFDKKAKIHAMSHILLPSYKIVQAKTPLKFPQKYADRGVKDLITETIANGATTRNLEAVIVGGAKIFKNHYNNIGEENVIMVKHELDRYEIKLVKEVVGGTSGRNIKYDTKNDSILVKKSGESDFKKII